MPMIGKRGYILVLAKGHPRANRDGYVPEHVLVVERALGHYLDPRHKVHHVDRNVANNTPPNLVACEDQAYHLFLHQRMRAREACGNPSALKCDRCGSYERQEDIAVYKATRPRKTIGFQARHRDCNASYVRAYAERKRSSK